MNALSLVLCLFFVTFVFHILVHRILHIFKIKSLASLFVYLIGIVFIPFNLYPISSRVLYVLLSLLACVFYLTPFLGGETPASMILAALQSKKRMTEKDILDLFSDEGLIGKRMQDLAVSGLLRKNKNGVTLSSSGRVLMRSILLYQKIFNRVLTG